MKINTKWFKGITRDKEAKQRLESEIGASVIVFDALTRILEEELKTLQTTNSSEERFQNPSWAEETAFNLGRQRQIFSILALIPKEGK